MRHLRREDELPSRYVEPEGAAVSI
jgi:hypothetical protein